MNDAPSLRGGEQDIDQFIKDVTAFKTGLAFSNEETCNAIASTAKDAGRTFMEYLRKYDAGRYALWGANEGEGMRHRIKERFKALTLADKAKLVASLRHKDNEETHTFYERCFTVGLRLTDLEYPKRVEAEDADKYISVANYNSAKKTYGDAKIEDFFVNGLNPEIRNKILE